MPRPGRQIGTAGAAAMQFAAIGCPVIAPRWASTSLPQSVPAATTAAARVTLSSPSRVRAQACGAYPSSAVGSMT